MLFENESIKVEVEEQANCLLSLRVEVKPEKVKKAYKTAIKRINKEVSIPGFRKGKAPEATIEKNYQSHIEKEWKELVIEDAFNGAIDLTRNPPYSKKTLQRPRLEKCSLENGALVHIVYEGYPKLPNVDFSSITLADIAKKEIPDSEVEAIVEELRREQATFEELQGRTLATGDFARISLEGIEDEKVLPLVANRRIEVEGDKLPSWLRDLLIGLESGQVKEHEHSGEEGLAGLPKKLKLTLHAIEKRNLPEVNDDLAKKLGFENVEAMRAEIRKNIEMSAEDELRNAKFDLLADALVEKYPFDLPKSLLNDVVDRNLSSQEEKLANLSEDEKVKKLEELQVEIEKEVSKKLRLHFLLREIGAKAQIVVSQEELNHRIHEALQRNPLYFGDTKDQEGLRQRISRFADNLLEEKILTYMLGEVEKNK